MNPIKLVAAVLIVAGLLGLLYGGFSYTKETHDLKLGPLELSVKEKQTVNVPVGQVSAQLWSERPCCYSETRRGRGKMPPNPSIERTNNVVSGLLAFASAAPPLFASHLKR